ncbi:MAG: VWA domain-containing protein, partial [Acidobacteriota bacterium]
GGDRYLMVRAPVALDKTPRAYHPRTWILLDDVSASRSPLELRAQQDLVDAFLRELDEHDKVGVVAFDVEARTKLAPTRVIDVDRKVVRDALKTEGGVGATDFSVGLDEALKQLAGTAGDDAMIVYLGDGVITAGPRELDALRGKLEGKAQFVGVGVGDAPDTQTLGALAAATGGYTTTIDLADDVGWRAFDLVAALHTARVTNVSARLVDASGQLVPSTTYLGSPQLADGEELDLVAKLAGSGTPAAVELDGTADGKPWHRRIALGNAHDGGYLPRLWAQRHIAARLLAKHEPAPPGETREQRDEQIRKEVVALGKRYFLLSRHTSLLVLENDAMYAQYGVTKGRGDTWAPYPLPATIPVTAPAPALTAQIATGSDEVVRAPLQVFYDASSYYGRGWGRRGAFAADETIALGNFGGVAVTRAEAIREAQMAGLLGENKWGDGLSALQSDLQSAAQPSSSSTGIEQRLDAANDRDEESEHAAPGPTPVTVAQPVPPEVTPPPQERWHAGGGGYLDGKQLAIGPLMVQRFLSPADPAFDDVSAFVSALVPDDADAWRAHLGAPETHAIDDAARAQLARARARLAAGIYRWGDRELALDAARHIGWRTTSDAGVAETASFDGATLTRRYAELDLDVTRAIGDDDVALAMAYLPLWIADPAHYARYFEVTARGPHDVVLARGKHVELVLSFDAEDRLVAIHDGKGGELVSVTWGASGPVAARVGGEAIAVGFTAEPVADAAAWAHGGARPGVVVELPLHAAATWQTRLDQLAPGSAEWRRAARQRLASLAATGDRGTLFAAYEQLQAHGGVELGDLVLASGGFATAPSDQQVASALAPLAFAPLAHYLTASRAWASSPHAERLAPETHDGIVGALWTLRAMSAQLADKPGKAAVDTMLQIPERASELRLVAAALLSRGYDLPAGELARAWHAAEIGRYVNFVRAQAAQLLAARGDYEAAADELARLASQLDLAAPPGRVDGAAAVFQASRRGTAGWQLVWATWRQRVLAGDSYAHVLSIVPLAAQRPGELTEVLERAAQLAGDDTRRAIEVAQLAVAYGQGAWAQTIVEPLLARQPSRELYQLDAQLELAQGHTADALAALEAAQDAGGDEPVPLQTMRGELAQILQLARQLALSSAGADRQRAVERAEKWAKRWRQVDPGNSSIDQTLGELLLAVGDRAGAWRQLSTTIERDPWSGAGYTIVAEAFERQGNVADALPFWHQAVIIDQTNPTPRLREAQALIALGRTAEGDGELREITTRKWHDAWSSVVWQAQALLERSKPQR